MKIKKSNAMDEVFYYGMCLFSFGVAFLVRIIITNAIRQALQDN